MAEQDTAGAGPGSESTDAARCAPWCGVHVQPPGCGVPRGAAVSAWAAKRAGRCVKQGHAQAFACLRFGRRMRRPQRPGLLEEFLVKRLFWVASPWMPCCNVLCRAAGAVRRWPIHRDVIDSSRREASRAAAMRASRCRRMTGDEGTGRWNASPAHCRAMLSTLAGLLFATRHDNSAQEDGAREKHGASIRSPARFAVRAPRRGDCLARPSGMHPAAAKPGSNARRCLSAGRGPRRGWRSRRAASHPACA